MRKEKKKRKKNGGERGKLIAYELSGLEKKKERGGERNERQEHVE